MKSRKNLPVQKVKCATCPFRKGSKYADLQDYLAESSLSDRSRICHNTGSNNAINKQTGKAERLCRGARDVQLQAFAAIGFIEAPTDQAWEKKRKEMNL